ncbi:MAG: hypothetical protein EOP56_13615 [Sphingobacteriales bacterium]|nr:MAG: hypothetical protein EOP56_13615 [Sphingobacteriales bacterium]
MIKNTKNKTAGLMSLLAMISKAIAYSLIIKEIIDFAVDRFQSLQPTISQEKETPKDATTQDTEHS